MRTLRTALFVLGLVASSAACRPADNAEPATLRIYSSLPLQGDSRPQSEDVVKAMKLALEEVGDSVGGFSIDYVSLDDASPEMGRWDPALIEANARKAAADPATIAYLGEFNSGATAVSLPVLNEAGILQVSPSNTYAGLTRVDGGAEPGEPDVYYPSGERTYGRVVPADHTQAAAQVGLMKQQGCTAVFVAHEEHAYGRGLAAVVTATAAEHDLRVTDTVAIDESARRFDDLAAQVRDARADCFFFGGITQPNALKVTAAVAAVRGLKLFFPDGCAESAFTEHLEDDVAPRVAITNPTLDQASYPPAGQAFFKAFDDAYHERPEPYAVYGYEAMSVVLDAIARAGEQAAPTAEGRQAVIDAFFATRSRDSVLGTYDIDAYGDTTLASYGAYRVEDGLLVFDKVVEAVVPSPTRGPELVVPSEGTAEDTTPLEGTWRGGKVTFQTLRRERSVKEARFVLDVNQAEKFLVTTLRLTGNQWQASLSVDGGPFSPAQAGTFTVDGPLIRMEDQAFGDRYVYRYTLRDETLTITLLRSNAGMAAPGVSDDAFQYAHYATPLTKIEGP